MKKLIIITALLSAFLTSCSTEEENINTENYSIENIEIEYSTLDIEIVQLLNDYRLSKGLNPLNILNVASKEANNHSLYMANQGEPSHDFFYLRSQNLQTAVNAKDVSENVAYGYTNAQSLVNAWINSEGHRNNIVNPLFTEIGIATKQDKNGKNYYTNIFVKL